MKAKQLLDAIGQLDERYIEEAEAEIHGRNRRLVVRWAFSLPCRRKRFFLRVYFHGSSILHVPKTDRANRIVFSVVNMDERYIEEAEAEIHGRNRRLVVRWAATAAAILLVFISVLGTVMSVNAGFRQMVFSFFHIGQVESVPDHNDRGFHVSKSDIGGRIQVGVQVIKHGVLPVILLTSL